MFKAIFSLLLLIIPLRSEITNRWSWCNSIESRAYFPPMSRASRVKNKIGCAIQVFEFKGLSNPFVFDKPDEHHFRIFWVNPDTNEVVGVSDGASFYLHADGFYSEITSMVEMFNLQDYEVVLFEHEQLSLTGTYLISRNSTSQNYITLLESSHPEGDYSKMYTEEEFLNLYNPIYLSSVTIRPQSTEL